MIDLFCGGRSDVALTRKGDQSYWDDVKAAVGL